MNNERKGTLVVLACHCVYDPQLDCIYAEHPEDRPVYESHISFAFNHLKWRVDNDPLLVISGGPTKIQRYSSESRSYLEMAKQIGLSIPENTTLEEYALTSIENLLFSLYVYKDIRKVYPNGIDVISWEFKRDRFMKTQEAINDWGKLEETWESLKFFPVGDLWGKPKKYAEAVEKNYIESLINGLKSYYENPKTIDTIAKRNPFDSRPLVKNRYKNYPLPF